MDARTNWPDGRLDRFEQRVDALEKSLGHRLEVVEGLSDSHEYTLNSMDKRATAHKTWQIAAPGWILAIASIIVQLANHH